MHTKCDNKGRVLLLFLVLHIFRVVVVVDIFGIFVEFLDLLFLRSFAMIANHLLKFGSVTGLMVP